MSDQTNQKPKAFRWLGPGVLHIHHKSGEVVVVPPGGKPSIVRKVENLIALGAERIEHLIKAGYAEELKIVDGIMEAIRPSVGTMTEDELTAAQTQAQETADAEKALSAQARPVTDQSGNAVQQALTDAPGPGQRAVSEQTVLRPGAGPR